ncbi:redoxin domain-containing protein [Streptomyces sp. TLI_105]|uniref:redoxin domain-containing protein n=1 Tax=Streptomyces sp. TLI_105 TaxID=1881019 RepID=UPI000B889FA1|nr:redoxin domain-containing protein [Streptomyces sp. TLI_105]
MYSTPQSRDVIGDFRLPGGHLDGDAFHRRGHTACEQRGKPLVHLPLHPGDDAPVCTARPCSYSGGLDLLRSAGVTVRGVGPQGPDGREQFARNRGLRPLLGSGEGRTVAKSFGSPRP